MFEYEYPQKVTAEILVISLEDIIIESLHMCSAFSHSHIDEKRSF